MTHNPRMGLIKKFFGGQKDAADAGHDSTQFRDSESDTEPGSGNTPKRELVHVVLRDTMRKHGIPSDWIESRVLTVAGANRVSGMHVQFIVRNGEDRLINYIHAFQDSFRAELAKYDPRADWLLSLTWQFEGTSGHRELGTAPAWASTDGGPEAPESAAQPQPAAAEEDDVMEDVKALLAIRDAAMALPEAELPRDFAPTHPGNEAAGNGDSSKRR
jgi:hypothetical protein